MKQILVLGLTLSATLSCRQSISSAIADRGALSGYPSGEDAAVYTAVLDTLFAGFRPSLVVLHDETTRRASRTWEERRNGFGLDSELIANVVRKSSVRVPITATFGYRLPVTLISDTIEGEISSRGLEIQRDTPQLGPAEGFWVVFHSKYPGAAGIVSLSRVGFSKTHMQAIVDFEFACGSMCGYYGIDILEKTESGWRVTRHLIEVIS